MTDHLQKAMAEERERLTKKRADLEGQIDTLHKELGLIERALRAMDAYDAALTDTPSPARTRTPSRAPRGSHRETVLSLLAASPNLEPKEIKAKLGDQAPKGLHNLLNILKKQGKVREDGGKYRLV